MDQADAATLQSLTNRFTLDGSTELETQLSEICHKVKESIAQVIPPERFELLLLGGGYGRGEGGVLRTEEGDRPYNDLEFYLFLHGPALLMQKLYGGKIHQLAEHLSFSAGVEIEVKIISLAKLQRSPVTMFYYDLLSGHKCLHGDEELLKNCLHHRAAHRIPLYEATRLLMNRCSGLLFSAEKLARPQFGEAEADFVFRNISKAKLALGDVILAARGEYHWSCRERHKRLAKLELHPELPLEEITIFHREGVDFKLRPTQSTAPREELKSLHGEVAGLSASVWLWLESRRLKTTFRTIRDYALNPQCKCPETLKFKNALINWKEFGVGSVFGPHSGYYPRERLLTTLPLLLWEPKTTTDPALLNKIQTELRTDAIDFGRLVAAYETIWKRFN